MRKLSPGKKRKCVQMYEQGASLAAIRQALHVDNPPVLAALADAGVGIRPPGRPRSRVHDKILRALVAGPPRTTSELATMTGHSPGAVKASLWLARNRDGLVDTAGRSGGGYLWTLTDAGAAAARELPAGIVQ